MIVNFFLKKENISFKRLLWGSDNSCCSAAQLCLTLCDPTDCPTPGFSLSTISWSLLKLKSIESMMPSNHLILCQPLLLLPSILPSIRVFSTSRLITSGGQSIGASASAQNRCSLSVSYLPFPFFCHLILPSTCALWKKGIRRCGWV